LLARGMLFKLLDRAARIDALGCDRVHRVAQHAHDLRRENRLQQVDGLLDVALVLGRDRAHFYVLTRAPAQRRHVGEEGLLRGDRVVRRAGVLR